MEMNIEQQQALIAQAQRLQEENQSLRSALAATAGVATTDKAKLGVPSDFNGNLNTDVNTWLGAMEIYLGESHTPRPRWPNVAATYLKGPATVWYQSFPMELRMTWTWEVFRTALMARFRPVDNNRVGRTQLMGLKMKGSDRGSGITQYINRFQTLCNTITDLSENEKFAYFTQGLTPDLQRLLIPLTHVNNVTEAMSMVMRYELLTPPSNSNNKDRYPSRTPMNSFIRRNDWGQDTLRGDINSRTPPTTTGGSTPMELGSMEGSNESTTDEELGVLRGNNRGPSLPQAEVEEYMRKGLCFRCKKQGHIKRDCPLNGSARK
jgi:hypothetical protein